MQIANRIEIAEPLSRLETQLLTWADWMKRIKSTARGCPGKSCGFIEAGCNSIADYEIQIDNSQSAAIDTLIFDLSDVENNAIRHQYLDERYRYQIVFYAANLKSARDNLQRALDRKRIL